MANYKMRDVSYNTLHNEIITPPRYAAEQFEEDNNHFHNNAHNENDHEDVTVIIHKVPENNKSGWTHIEDLDSFFKKMYRYYSKGGFFAMFVADACQLFQYGFVIFFITILFHCVNYPVLFREDATQSKFKNVTFADIFYPSCAQRVTLKWWILVSVCGVVGFVKLAKSTSNLFHAYDTKLFYNNALKIKDSDLGWLSWYSIQCKVREAQREWQMCIHKQQITELDIYHRILRFDNYMVAMVNKRLLPLYLSMPCFGDVPYLSKGLKYNLELLLFKSPWSPWENHWHLRDSYKDASQRLALAQELRNQITLLAGLNFILAPLILAWQILYFFFSYAELIKRSPESLGLRTWSLYARILLRHFNELDHEISDRLNRAHKPATKYLASFPSPAATLIAKNIAFLCASILGVVVALSVYNETVLTVENMLTLITALGILLAGARSFIPEEGIRQRSSEELLVQVLGHVHYLPASWRGKAHTKNVAGHFQQLFQYRATYILIELFSPIISPFIIYSLRSRALDIVDFYRNFTVSVLDIGDVCSFAQMDVRKHGNPEWPAGKKEDVECHENIPQYQQGEDGKTELSLVAFSCRNPGWRAALKGQGEYLQALHDDVTDATNTFLSLNPLSCHKNMNKTILCSFYNQAILNDDAIGVHSGNPQNNPRSPDEQNILEVDEESENPTTSTNYLESKSIINDRNESCAQEEKDMSISALHLYDLHLAKVGPRSTRQSVSIAEDPLQASTQRSQSRRTIPSNEDTPLLKKPRP